MLDIKKKFRLILCLSFFLFLYSSPLVAATPTDTLNPTQQEPSPPSDFNLNSESLSQPMPISYEKAFIKMIVSVVGLMIFVLFTVWAVRKLGRSKWGGFGSSRSIQIIEKKLLSPKSVLYLIEVENKRFLIAESQLEVRRLGSLEEHSETPSEEIT